MLGKLGEHIGTGIGVGLSNGLSGLGTLLGSEISSGPNGLEITSPSGKKFQLTQDEERDLVKKAAEQQMIAKINRRTDFTKAIIQAIGLAVGAALAAYIIKEVSERLKKCRFQEK